jgi:hypothetical protein
MLNALRSGMPALRAVRVLGGFRSLSTSAAPIAVIGAGKVEDEFVMWQVLWSPLIIAD